MTQPNEATLYVDNTRVSSFFKCPRAFYFRHVRGWERDVTKTSLAFGAAWHVAMEVVWGMAQESVGDRELVEMACGAFNQKWSDEGFDPNNYDLSEKRNPGLARDMLFEYVDKYRQWLRSIEILAIEQPFVIPLLTFNNDSGDVVVSYIGRWDKVWAETTAGFRSIFVGEHKTTSLYRKEGIFAKEWMISFSPDSQVDGYAFAAHAVWGEEAKGVIVDGAMVHKSVRGFTKIPVRRTREKLDSWYFNTRYWVNEILENMQMLEKHEEEAGVALEEARYLAAFPQRTEQCIHKYGICSYHDVCKYGDANPARISQPPEGFKLNPWDPFSHNVDEGQEIMVVGSAGKEAANG